MERQVSPAPLIKGFSSNPSYFLLNVRFSGFVPPVFFFFFFKRLNKSQLIEKKKPPFGERWNVGKEFFFYDIKTIWTIRSKLCV